MRSLAPKIRWMEQNPAGFSKKMLDAGFWKSRVFTRLEYFENAGFWIQRFQKIRWMDENAGFWKSRVAFGTKNSAGNSSVSNWGFDLDLQTLDLQTLDWEILLNIRIFELLKSCHSSPCNAFKHSIDWIISTTGSDNIAAEARKVPTLRQIILKLYE